MNNYLHSLPFHSGPGNSSDCDCPGQAFDPAKFKMYSEKDRLPTFVLRLPSMGENPDTTYANECVRVFTCDAEQMVANLTMEETGVKMHKDAVSYFLTYDGSLIPNFGLECGKCYRLKIMSFWSEAFWVTDVAQSKITFEFSNKSQLGDVPYQKPVNFVQRLIVDGELCSLDAEYFANKKADANGNETITFQRLTQRKALYIYSAPEFIEQLIGAIQMHDSYSISHSGKTYAPLKKRTTIEVAKNGCCDYDLTLTLPLRDSRIAGGECQTDSDGTLIEVDIPDDLPDSCAVDNDYVGTDEVLCLKFGQVPRGILPPITPVGTPPVGTPCPPAGQVVSQNTTSVNCTNAFEYEGVRYKKRVTKQIADGNCGTTEQVSYVEPCDVESTHQVTNLQCEGTVNPLPPVGTPPVGTPPVGTPPVGTPPVGTPPVGTPPAGGSYPNQYEFLMGTTGYGFDPDATHGIAPEWVEKIEAFNYPWGWGITGIALWVNWDKYEKTQGVYETAAMQRVINYCNARGLGLSLVWNGRRSSFDNFATEAEKVKLSNGNIFSDAFDYYTSYGCDRTNTMIANAIKSMCNIWKTYNRAFYFGVSGGHAGELNNHVKEMGGPNVGLGDFCADNMSRFQQWCTSRGLASYGNPQIIVPSDYMWPYPNFSDPTSLEFARFTTYNIYKYFKNACQAVKSVVNKPCIYYYAAATAGVQFRTTANAPMNFIAGPGDGMYGSDGDALYDHNAKIKVNSVNRGTFPNGISCCEFDPDDTSTYRYDVGGAPPFGQANPQYGAWKATCEKLYQKGAKVIHTAMAFSVGEIQGASGMLQDLRQSYIGKPYNPPSVNSDNTSTVEVTQKYRNSQDLADGIDYVNRYIKYTSNDYWGGVNPPA